VKRNRLPRPSSATRSIICGMRSPLPAMTKVTPGRTASTFAAASTNTPGPFWCVIRPRNSTIFSPGRFETPYAPTAPPRKTAL